MPEIPAYFLIFIFSLFIHLNFGVNSSMICLSDEFFVVQVKTDRA